MGREKRLSIYRRKTACRKDTAMMNRSAVKRSAKILTLLSVTVAALQIPLLMLWTIAVDTMITCSCGLIATHDPSGKSTFELAFQWEKFWEVFPSFLPIFLALTACFVLSVVGLITVLRKKQVTVPTICFYGVTVLACGFLCFAFARPATVLGTEIAHQLTLHEFMFYRYFCGLEWRFNVDRFPLLEAIKFILLGLHMAGSGALCGLGIADRIRRRRATPAPMEPELYELKGRHTE